MMRNIAYKKEILAELFSLDKGDVESLILSEGIPIFSTADRGFIGYLPSLNSSFLIEDEKIEKRIASNIKVENYLTVLEDSIISVSSRLPHLLPATTYLYNNDWFEEASKFLTIDNNFSLLISNRKELPFYCGHHKLITRLAENMSGDIYIENALLWKKKMENR